MKKWSENEGFSGLKDELCMFLLAQARGNGVVMPNVAEKLDFWVRKTVKFNEISAKNENIHEMGRELSFLSFD